MKKLFNFALVVPVIVYSIFLIALPILYIFILSFLKNDFYGGIINEVTLNNYLSLLDFVYLKVFLKSFLVALITTILCIIIAYPFCIFVSKKSSYAKKIFMTLVIIPFLTNSLIRTYGIIILLRKEGIINILLQSLNIIDNPIQLMYNDFGIIFGMVYTLLPFMILPLFSSVDKINPSIIEAASDLGANKSKIFKEIILPQTIPGLFNGSLMVFIPTIGFFFISDILGGGKLMLLGNLIKNQFLTARNWPFGAAISIILILITFCLVKIYKKLGGDMDELGGF
ncbi:MAG: ABC transporter permease [Bacilli bacterium]|nr:ABC transporter permease [Bacilli bacterium]